jgi:hypothetical protein
MSGIVLKNWRYYHNVSIVDDTEKGAVSKPPFLRIQQQACELPTYCMWSSQAKSYTYCKNLTLCPSFIPFNNTKTNIHYSGSGKI